LAGARRAACDALLTKAEALILDGPGTGVCNSRAMGSIPTSAFLFYILKPFKVKDK
jgi:hypothetical protein